MSSRSWSLRVQDILNAIDRIQKSTSSMTFSEFSDNKTLMKAVLYDFIVIGEAALNIPGEVKAQNPAIPWRIMSDMRNVMAHEYFRVEPEIVWDTIHSNLPGLVKPLQQLLS
ncbi:HepT-like ribonuclease domain-containing protein [Acaryochloris thomasi]|nr:DUF86 domain-containing protein [Acaryochloris thomasi]